MTMYFHLRRGAICLALAGLSGCSWLPPLVGPDYSPPKVAVPDTWSQRTADGRPAPEPAELATWWRRLNDPLLDELMAQALANSLDLRSAQARVRQARASRDLAVGGLFPTIQGSVAGNRTKASSATSAPAAVRNIYNGGFDASWEPDIFGGTRRGIEAAEADLASSQANVDGAKVSLSAEVALNYVEVRSYQQRLAIARENLNSQSETLEITQWRAQAGLATALDVEQARTTREQTRATIPSLQSSLVQAENRLAILLGQPPGSLHGQLAEARPLPRAPLDVAVGIPADTLRQRPDVRAAERTLAAETARVGQKTAARYPSLALTGSFGWQAFSLGALGNTGTLTRAVTGTLAATLFDGGKLRAQVEVQNAVQEQALVAYQQTVLTALEDVENALAAYASGRDREDARRQAAEAARSAADLARKQYQAGLADFQKVLDTERTLLTAEDNLATAQSDVLTAVIQLYKAMGGGWRNEATTSAMPNPSEESKKS